MKDCLILCKNKTEELSFHSLCASVCAFLPLNAPLHVPPLPAGGSAPSAGCASAHEPLQRQGETTLMHEDGFNGAGKEKKKNPETKETAVEKIIFQITKSL